MTETRCAHGIDGSEAGHPGGHPRCEDCGAEVGLHLVGDVFRCEEGCEPPDLIAEVRALAAES